MHKKNLTGASGIITKGMDRTEKRGRIPPLQQVTRGTGSRFVSRFSRTNRASGTTTRTGRTASRYNTGLADTGRINPRAVRAATGSLKGAIRPGRVRGMKL